MKSSKFQIGQRVIIPTPDGELVPAKIMDAVRDREYVVRVMPDMLACDYSGLRYSVPEEILLQHNPYRYVAMDSLPITNIH